MITPDNEPLTAVCVVCGEDLPVCCNSGYTELDGGRVDHIDPVCVACCSSNHKGARWDGQCIAGGTYERCD